MFIIPSNKTYNSQVVHNGLARADKQLLNTGSNPVLTTKKIKIMKKEKTYFDGIMVGFGITAIIYSVLLGIVIRMLTQ
jgi:hypothetical protein